ncbi:MAG TPA: type II toxin-antitoxin system RelE/ParE family toxin [Rhizomicrobium sp.]|jgi:proteic killer suppression protein|nr:type II toxin-antitoxin system RelE/ParE family toxin [Rhizomicrobium sp.]
MIRSWANSASLQFAQTGKSKFSGLDTTRADLLLRLLDRVRSLNEISPLKSVGLHPLKGERKGLWAITVNGPWRICFRFEDGDAHDVEIIDYH